MAGPFTVQQSLHGQPSVTTLNAPVPLLGIRPECGDAQPHGRSGLPSTH
jgi:hypothetical protein